MPNIMQADLNALVNAHDAYCRALERVTGVGVASVVRVPSGTVLAGIATAAGAPARRLRSGRVGVAYRGLLFSMPASDGREGAA